MKPPMATMITTNHRTPHPSAKIEKLWGRIMQQTAKAAWQYNHGQSGHNLQLEDRQMQCTIDMPRMQHRSVESET